MLKYRFYMIRSQVELSKSTLFLSLSVRNIFKGNAFFFNWISPFICILLYV